MLLMKPTFASYWGGGQGPLLCCANTQIILSSISTLYLNFVQVCLVQVAGVLITSCLLATSANAKSEKNEDLRLLPTQHSSYTTHTCMNNFPMKNACLNPALTVRNRGTPFIEIFHTYKRLKIVDTILLLSST